MSDKKESKGQPSESKEEKDKKLKDGEKEAEQSFARRDRLVEIEERVQKLWKKNKIYHTDAKDSKAKGKFFATFPYPYMNGVLHLGHAFTLAKTEFACRYHRLLGKEVLFPFGFHCTGMPIAACADKLKREVQEYGNPPEFPEEEEEDKKEEKEAPKPTATPAKKKGKGKVKKKASKLQYQWNIMEEMGLEDDIGEFQSSLRWLKYFPPVAKKHLERFGLRTDWRRSFITTSVNPYYDSFIRWQFNTLRKKGKIDFGKRACVFSPLDSQPCADHDRASGEGVLPQEYTLVKLELLSPLPPKLASIPKKKGQKFYLPAATLRPETMYGQTNVFVLPEGDYGIYEINDSEIFIQSDRSALNMSYQGLTPVYAKPSLIGRIPGQEILGAAVSAPLAQYERVYVLPLLTIKMTKGTGVVTSVPSDAPDDYAALMDLKNKPAMRQKYKIKDEMVLPFEVVPIIETPGLGTTPAVDLCKEAKVTGQNDTVKLEAIKARVYLDSFYKGIMKIGKYKDQKVSVVKPLIKQQLVEDKQALIYYEPESKVMSRSGVECVVAMTDQWYLKYGEDEWKAAVTRHLEKTLNTYNPKAKDMFKHTLDWLHEWACSRSYGLGTSLPWDQQFVIESLSDSTIYMAYYTVAHFLQGGNLEGSKAGPFGIKPDQLTDDVWNYVFRNKEFPEYPKECSIPKAQLDQMKQEFEFWYPMDLRVSGKDLIGNHLTMALYNHAAIWDKQPELWPVSFFTNGHLMINAEKMSKSTGNFLTLDQAIHLYGADATRFALADAGDNLEDANFAADTANSIILKLTKEETWITETLASRNDLRTGSLNFFDKAFLNEINQRILDSRPAFESMLYHVALAEGFHKLTSARDMYRVDLGEAQDSPAMHRDAVLRYMEVFVILLSPFCPHYAQHIWTLLGKEGFLDEHGLWPHHDPVDPILHKQISYLRTTSENLRHALGRKLDLMRKKSTTPVDPRSLNAVIIYVADGHPQWIRKTIGVIKELWDGKTLPDSRELATRLNKLDISAKDKQRAIKFGAAVRGDLEQKGSQALDITLPFDEEKLLKEHVELVTRGLKLSHVEVKKVSPDKAETVVPKSPASGPGGGKDEPFIIETLPGEPVSYFFKKEPTPL